MIFTKENGGETAINLSLINHIDNDFDSFYVSLTGGTVILKKDENSQKLFDWFAAKTEKDMLSKQDINSAVDSAVKNSMQHVQNLLSQIKK